MRKSRPIRFATERGLANVLRGGYLTEVREYLSILRRCCQFLRTTAVAAAADYQSFERPAICPGMEQRGICAHPGLVFAAGKPDGRKVQHVRRGARFFTRSCDLAVSRRASQHQDSAQRFQSFESSRNFPGVTPVILRNTRVKFACDPKPVSTATWESEQAVDASIFWAA
jgi:hypothetical protein